MPNTASDHTAFRAKASLGTLAPGESSPWCVVFFGRSPGAIADSHLLELLNPGAEGDFFWVKPGVCTWDWLINGAKVEGFTYRINYESYVRLPATSPLCATLYLEKGSL